MDRLQFFWISFFHPAEKTALSFFYLSQMSSQNVPQHAAHLI